MNRYRKMKIVRVGACVAACCLPGLAFAHPGHGTGGFLEGWAHPFGGLDHLVGMVSMGIWAAMASTYRQRAAVLISFLVGMLAGSVLGMQGMAPSWVESPLMASVLATGTLLLWAKPCPMLVRMVVAACFAVGHGLAHGMEIPEMVAPSSYFMGFLLATGVLLSLGIWVGRWVHRSIGRTRWAGAGVLGLALIAMGS